MDDFHENVKETECGIICRLINGCLICRLDHFKVPAREFVGEQLEDGHQGFVQTVFFIEVFYLGALLPDYSVKPFNGSQAAFRLTDWGSLPPLNKTEGIPYLVAEVTSLLAE